MDKPGFLHLYECQYQSSVKMKVFQGHLLSKSGNQHIAKGKKIDPKKNCFLHTITMKWMAHYFNHFDRVDDN